MVNNELRELRHQYKAAYTTYMRSVQALSDASQNGELPTAAVLKAEGRAFADLMAVRQALLEALQAYSNDGNRS